MVTNCVWNTRSRGCARRAASKTASATAPGLAPSATAGRPSASFLARTSAATLSSRRKYTCHSTLLCAQFRSPRSSRRLAAEMSPLCLYSQLAAKHHSPAHDGLSRRPCDVTSERSRALPCEKQNVAKSSHSPTFPGYLRSTRWYRTCTFRMKAWPTALARAELPPARARCEEARRRRSFRSDLRKRKNASEREERSIRRRVVPCAGCAACADPSRTE